MNSKVKNIFMLLAAGYILYTGITTIQGVLAGVTSANTFFVVVGVVFILFGIAAIIFYGRAILKEMREETQQDDETVDISETVDRNEIVDTNEVLESEIVDTKVSEISEANPEEETKS